MPRRPKPPEQVEFERNCRQMHLQMIKDFQNENPETFTTEELLALVLSFSLQKCDYRQETKRILEEHGSYHNLLNCRAEYLMVDKMIRMNTALMLKGIPAMVKKARLAQRPKHRKIKTPEAARVYLEPYFIGYNFEQAFLLLLSDYYYPKEVIMLGEGSGGEVYIDKRRILREALLKDSKKLILAHSHICKHAQPSKNDKLATVDIANMFRSIQVELLDHLIISSEECYFLSQDEEMDKSILAFSPREPVSIFD